MLRLGHTAVKASELIGGELANCSKRLLTDFFRDGCRNTRALGSRLSHRLRADDRRIPGVLQKPAAMTSARQFLKFELPSLKPGDHWYVVIRCWPSSSRPSPGRAVNGTRRDQEAADRVHLGPPGALPAHRLVHLQWYSGQICGRVQQKLWPEPRCDRRHPASSMRTLCPVSREDGLGGARRARGAQPEPARWRGRLAPPPGAPSIRGHDVKPLQARHPPLPPQLPRQARLAGRNRRERGRTRRRSRRPSTVPSPTWSGRSKPTPTGSMPRSIRRQLTRQCSGGAAAGDTRAIGSREPKAAGFSHPRNRAQLSTIWNSYVRDKPLA